jgi:hypothetical protein
MGHSNYPKLFFGCILTYEEFVKVVQTFSEVVEEDDIRDFYEQELYKILNEKYHGLSLKDAAPYYDPEFTEHTFYISLGEAECSYDSARLSVENAKRILNSFPETSYKKFFGDIKLEYREPEFIAICNVH